MRGYIRVLSFCSLLILMTLGVQASFAFEQIGVCPHLPTGEKAEAIWAAKIPWARIDFRWDLVQPVGILSNLSGNNFKWNKVGPTIQALECQDGLSSPCPCSGGGNCGVKILAGLGGAPIWANGGQSDEYPPRTTAEIAAWKYFVKRSVEMYRTQVDVWAIWNEPDLEDFFVGTAEEYRNNILIPAIEAIKEVEAQCNCNIEIAAPDVSNRTDISGFLIQTLLPPVSFDIDYLTYHSYNNSLEGDFVAASFANTQFLGIPHIWLTETGEKNPSWPDVDSLYSWMQQPGPKPGLAFYYQLVDGSGGSDYGLLENIGGTLVPRDGYHRIREETILNGDAAFITDNLPHYIGPDTPIQNLVFFVRNIGDAVWSETLFYRIRLTRLTDYSESIYFLPEGLVFPGGNSVVYAGTIWSPGVIGDATYRIELLAESSSGYYSIIESYNHNMHVTYDPPPPPTIGNWSQ